MKNEKREPLRTGYLSMVLQERLELSDASGLISGVVDYASDPDIAGVVVVYRTKRAAKKHGVANAVAIEYKHKTNENH
jgi:hypothetical protein